MARAPFKLRSASPFKKDERMVHSEGGKNLLKDVNIKKGKKSIYTYRQMHKDLLSKGMSQADADAEVQKAKGYNQTKYGTQNPTKEGLTNNYREEKGSMDMKDVSSDGKDAKDGSIMDSFSPQETRMLIRERKINKNRKDKYENKNRRQTGRYDNALKKAIKSGMTKEEFDLTKKGKRLNMKVNQSQENIDDYTTGYKRSQMANQQGVNQADGTRVEYDPDNVSMKKATAATEGSSTTEATADDIANLRNTSEIDLGSDTSDSSYTESLSGGSNKPIGGAGPADAGTTDSSTETTETGNSSLKDAAGKVKAGILAASLGPLGGLMNIDADGDGDTVLNDKNNDGTMLTRFISRITGGGKDDDSATKYGRDRSAAPFKLKKYK